MGIDINAMHYTGMAAMHLRPGIEYDPLLFAVSVLIAIGASAGGTVRVSSKRVKDAIVIEVSDTGIGIVPAFLPYVFDRFRQADADALAGLTILVVDDERDSLDIVHYVLADMGATIVSASTAYEALQMIDQLKPDLMVSDIGMPGMDGLELVRRVRASHNPHVAGVRALALTAFSRREDRLRSLEAGFDEYLSKPVAPAELVRAVLTLCDTRLQQPVPVPKRV